MSTRCHFADQMDDKEFGCGHGFSAYACMQKYMLPAVLKEQLLLSEVNANV